jgi:hypothetical protein
MGVGDMKREREQERGRKSELKRRHPSEIDMVDYAVK